MSEQYKSMLLRLLQKHGICMKCGELIEHHYNEPYASCKCTTSEWTGKYTPHMESHKPVFTLN